MVNVVTAIGVGKKQLVTAYATQIVQGRRIVVEKSDAGAKVRYEKVIRDGYNEIVKVVAPEPLEWAYLNGKTYVVFGRELKLSPVPIVDSERVFMKLLSSTTTRISTSSMIYDGNNACKVVFRTASATYEGIFLVPSMLLVKLSIQKEEKELTLSYSQINFTDKKYFATVLKGFKISDTPPSTIEVEIGKIVYHLENVNVTSFSGWGMTLAIIDGVAPNTGHIVVYIFKKGEKLSTSSLSIRFKAHGLTTLSLDHDGLKFLFVSNADKEKLKKWIEEVLKSKR